MKPFTWIRQLPVKLNAAIRSFNELNDGYNNHYCHFKPNRKQKKYTSTWDTVLCEKLIFSVSSLQHWGDCASRLWGRWEEKTLVEQMELCLFSHLCTSSPITPWGSEVTSQWPTVKCQGWKKPFVSIKKKSVLSESTCSFLFWRNWARRLGLDGSCLGLGTEAGDDWGLPLLSESAQRKMKHQKQDQARLQNSQISIIHQLPPIYGVLKGTLGKFRPSKSINHDFMRSEWSEKGQSQNVTCNDRSW